MFARVRPFLVFALAAIVVVLCYLSYRVEMRSHALKADEMELSSINYGLFDPDRWMDALSSIISDKVMTYKIDGSDRATLKKQLEKILREVLVGVHQTVERQDHGVKGAMRKAVFNAVVPMDAIRSDIPHYADRILDEVDQPENREKLKAFVLSQLDTLSAQTSGKIDMHLYDEIMARRGFTDPRDGIFQLRKERGVQMAKLSKLGWMLTLSVVLMVVLFIVRTPVRGWELSVLVGTAIVLLVTALAMPMLDIEARISEFSLTVLGAPITFKDQVLFYESRSILQVIWLLLKEHDVGLVLVAALVFCFSVAFPFIKLILSFIAALRLKLPTHPVARFFVLKSAKWSMADVIVVAMFMAYLGFNGVVSGQLSDLRDYMQGVHIMTTNNTELEFGFYLFTAYVVLGMVMSVLLKRAITAEVGAAED